MKLAYNSVFEADYAELVVHFNEVGGVPLSHKFEDDVVSLTENLLKFPEMGRRRDDLKPDGLRSFRLRHFSKYILFYQIKGNELLLVRLRYGGMDLPMLFMTFN